MDIVHCIDNKFVMQCGVTMTSICENNKNEDIYFHILTDGLSDKNSLSLERIAIKYGKKIQIYRIDKSILKNCPVEESDRVSLAAYFRILIPEILPVSVEKVLYLDCDIIVHGSIADLWNSDISEVAAGVVADIDTDIPRPYNQLDYDRELGYFNSGVLLANLSYWRKHHISSQTLDFIKNNPSRIRYWDQDALNYVLKECKKNLPLKYNVQSPFYFEIPVLYKKSWSDLEEAIKNPVILHYISFLKPWHIECDHPLKSEYIKYLRLTEWKGKLIYKYKGKRRLLYILRRLWHKGNIPNNYKNIKG